MGNIIGCRGETWRKEDKPFVWLGNMEINGDTIYKGLISTSKDFCEICTIPEVGLIAERFKKQLKHANGMYLHYDNKVIEIKQYLELTLRPTNSVRDPLVTNFLVIPNTKTNSEYDFIFGNNLLKYFGFRLMPDPKETKHLKVQERETIESKILAQKVYVSPKKCRLVPISSCFYKEYNGLVIHYNSFRLIRKFGSVFGQLDSEGMRVTPMEIKTNNGDKPTTTYSRPRPSEKSLLVSKTEELFKLGIIERSQSKYVNQPKLKPKKDKSYRLILNCRSLNEVTEPFSHPHPKLKNLHHLIVGMNWFSSLDCTQGTYQIKLKPSDCHKTSFTTPIGKYQYKRCPFGTKNSTSYFQYQMDQIFAEGLKEKWCLIYVDDILVFAKTRSEHAKHLKWVLDKCLQYNIKLNLSKCEFVKKQVDFCGYSVGPKFKPTKSKIEAFMSMERPENRKELTKVLHKFESYKLFLSDPVSKRNLDTLFALARRQDEFAWNKRSRQAYRGIIDALMKAADGTLDESYWRRYMDDEFN